MKSDKHECCDYAGERCNDCTQLKKNISEVIMENYFIDCCGGIGFEDKPELDEKFGIFTNCPECGTRRVLSSSSDTLDDAYTENMMLVGC